MRTKTLALSALLTTVCSASLFAQSNVYSLNAVGYTTIQVPPKDLAIFTCPVITYNDPVTGVPNTVNILLNNGAGGPFGAGGLNGSVVYFFVAGTGPGSGYSTDDAVAIGTKKGQTSNTNGWAENGTNVMAPGVGCWFQNGTTNTLQFTFVGTVPQGSLTNSLQAGLNLIGSAVPTYGDLQTNSITGFTNYNIGDVFYMYDPIQAYSGGVGGTYEVVASTGKHPGLGYHNNFAPGDATTFNVTQGFWYFNNGAAFNWIENFSVNP